MRCLYCGKELALLKRWTGGGEFCSDAHRLRYQEEYNQLALNRLMQAKPQNEAPPVGEPKPAVPTKPLAVAESPAYTAPAEPDSLKVSEGNRPKPPYRDIPAPVAPRAATPEPSIPRVEPKPAAPKVYEQPAPPEAPAPAEAAGFLVERPFAILTDVAPVFRPDMEFLAAVSAALPSHTFEPLDSRQDTFQLETAGLVTFQPSNRASNYTANGSRERRLEVRDFVRTAPIVEIDLRPAGETGLETSSEAMDILIFPQPPQGLPVLWQEPPVGFTISATELGDLARLSFTTTGFAEQDESKESERDTAAVEQPPAVALVLEEAAVETHVEAKTPAPVEAVAELLPEPEPINHVAEPVVNQVAEPVVEPVVAPVAEPTQPVPDLVTKPLPLVLHVATPSKGKPAQVFFSAPNAVDVQVPRSTSLPLRPVMTIGPAPVKEIEKPVEKKVPERPAPAVVKNDAKVDLKSEPKKPVVTPAPVRPDPRVVAAKLRRPTPEVQPPVKAPEPAPVKEAVPVLKQAAKTEIPSAPKPPAKKPEVREDVKVKEEAKPAAAAASYGSSDLGLPHLSMQPPPGFLGRLPLVAKIGIAVALLAGVGTVIAFSSKSGGAAVPSSAPGTIIAGTTLPVGEAGWITDWGADTGVRRTRQISILRSSQTLTDYRIQMQGQIETKAIGWVFRAADPKNFYVTKLEIIKPGLEPSVAVVRFAVINGEEQAHAQLPLPMKVRRDTMYKIRFDAVGSHFTTYVQDEKVDDWTDTHIKSGGVGLYSERGEVMTLKGGMSVLPLIVQK